MSEEVKVQNQELEQITNTILKSGLPEAKAQEIIDSLATVILDKVPKWESLDAGVEVEDHTDKNNMKLAASIRKSIANTRIEGKKFIDNKRSLIAAKIAVDTLEDKTWLKVNQVLESIAKSYESKLKFKEDTFIRWQEAEILRIRLDRIEKLSPYCENATRYITDDMNESEYLELLSDFKTMHEAKKRKEAQDALDAENAYKEKLKKEEEDEKERLRMIEENKKLVQIVNSNEKTIAVLKEVCNVIKEPEPSIENDFYIGHVFDTPNISNEELLKHDCDVIRLRMEIFDRAKMTSIPLHNDELLSKYTQLLSVQDAYLSQLKIFTSEILKEFGYDCTFS